MICHPSRASARGESAFSDNRQLPTGDYFDLSSPATPHYASLISLGPRRSFGWICKACMKFAWRSGSRASRSRPCPPSNAHISRVPKFGLSSWAERSPASTSIHVLCGSGERAVEGPAVR